MPTRNTPFQQRSLSHVQNTMNTVSDESSRAVFPTLDTDRRLNILTLLKIVGRKIQRSDVKQRTYWDVLAYLPRVFIRCGKTSKQKQRATTSIQSVQLLYQYFLSCV
jgi:hypothetical protein